MLQTGWLRCQKTVVSQDGFCCEVSVAADATVVCGTMHDGGMSIASLHPLEPAAWAQQHFAAAKLGDRRRVQRAVTLAAGMARQPGGTIPQLFLHRYGVKATYTLFDRPGVTAEHLQAGPQSLVKARLQMPGTCLLLEDTTELGWTRVHPVEDLASIGNLQSNQCRGFLLHTTLAVRRLCGIDNDKPNAGRPAVEVLGIADQEYVLEEATSSGREGWRRAWLRRSGPTETLHGVAA